MSEKVGNTDQGYRQYHTYLVKRLKNSVWHRNTSKVSLVETVVRSISDEFPNLQPFKKRLLIFVALFGYCTGIAFTTNAGMYWLQLIDNAVNLSIPLIALWECVLIAWVYGSQRFLDDIQSMIGKRSQAWCCFWCILWCYISPSVLTFIYIFNAISYKPTSYGDYIYPLWADIMAWIIIILPVMIIIITSLHEICLTPKNLTFKQKRKYLLRATVEWIPGDHRGATYNA